MAVTTPNQVLMCAATGVTTAATSVDAADATTHCSRLDGFRMTTACDLFRVEPLRPEWQNDAIAEVGVL